MKQTLQVYSIFLYRALERRLSVRNLYRVLLPLAWLRAGLTFSFRKNNSPELPECLRVKRSMRQKFQQRAATFLNNVLDHFPEQLATPKWRGMCRMKGLDRVQAAQQNGRPVILVLLHFGPYGLARVWLRSAGIPIAALAGGWIENRPPFRQRLDKYIPLPGIPTVFYLDQLRQTMNFLAAGNVLGILIDNIYANKYLLIPFCEGWNLQVATGALRMAIRHRAELIPCFIIDEGRWRFRLELCRPVPQEFLDNEADWSRAGKHVLDEIIPHLLAHPEQCHRELIKCLKKTGA